MTALLVVSGFLVRWCAQRTDKVSLQEARNEKLLTIREYHRCHWPQSREVGTEVGSSSHQLYTYYSTRAGMVLTTLAFSFEKNC